MTTTKNIHQRLAEVMNDVTYIQKERKQGMNYTIVSHDAVTAKVRPALLKAGIVYYPVRCDYSHNGNRAECAMTVRFVNIDAPTDFFDVPTFGYGIDPQDKGPGKAMSYAVKYALLKALGLETGDDPDLDSIDHTPASRQPANTPAPAMTPAMQNLWDEQEALESMRGLKSFWDDHGSTIKGFPEVHRNRFIARKDELKAQFNTNAQTLLAGE